MPGGLDRTFSDAFNPLGTGMPETHKVLGAERNMLVHHVVTEMLCFILVCSIRPCCIGNEIAEMGSKVVARI